MARRALLLSLALACSGLASGARAACGPTRDEAGKPDTRLTADVLVNGRGPYKFVVDTTADSSAIGQRLARGLQLPPGTPVILNGMTSRVTINRVKVAELTFGPTINRNLQLPALSEDALGGDGLLGTDAFARQRLIMDFEKHQVAVEASSRPALPAPGETQMTARRQRGQLILTEVRAAGVPLNAVIQASSEITIGNSALRARLRPGPLETIDVVGVTGETVKMQLARIGELELGPLIFRDVPVAFADAPPFARWGLSDQPALLVGADLLSRFRSVSLDFRERKIRFRPRAAPASEAPPPTVASATCGKGE